jgi:chromosome partitioning protein
VGDHVITLLPHHPIITIRFKARGNKGAKNTMHKIAAGNPKGGTGKSSILINLFCQALAAGESAALLDMDTLQGTSDGWGKRRGLNGRNEICKVEAHQLESKLQELEAAGIAWCFLDLPGRNAAAANAGMKAADLILVPARPTDTDVEASIPIIQSAKAAQKNYAFVMSLAPPQGNALRARKVAEILREGGHPVALPIIVQRLIVSDAYSLGKGANEFEPGGESAAEFADLFNWVRGQIS